MPRPSAVRPELKSLLFMALEEDYGIVVREAQHLSKLRERLLFLRKEDPLFQFLSIIISPEHPETDLWIVRTKREKIEEENGEEV